MRVYFYLTLTSSFILLRLLNAQSTDQLLVKQDGRFMGTLESNNVQDNSGLMDRFQLDMQWWTLLSEPVEYYDITWFSTGKYTVQVKGERRTITKAKLNKYPDLVRRFERITPIDLKIEISGEADGGTAEVKRGKALNTSGFNKRARSNFKKNGQAYDRYQLWGDIVYVIPYAYLVPSYAGKKGNGIVPGSQHWNEFIFWPKKTSYFNRMVPYQKGNKNDQTLLKQNKSRFSRTQSFNLSARIINIEWPLTEMRNIIEKYDRYESGLESPSEAKAETEELNNLLSDISEQPITGFQIQSKNGKEGVVADDGRILIPFKNWDITEFDTKTGLAQVEKDLEVVSKSGSCDKVFKAQIKEVMTVDSSGKPVMHKRKIAVPYYETGETGALTLVAGRFDETSEEREIRERKEKEAKKRREAERKRCKALNNPIFEAFKRDLQAKGIDTSRL